MYQVVVCRDLRTIGSTSVLEFWKFQRRQCRSRLWYFGSRSDGEAAMHQHLSCALSRLSSSEPDSILRVSGRLPGLHPIHLHGFRTGMTDVLFLRQSEPVPEADRDVDLVADQSATRVFPGVAHIAIDEVIRAPFIGQAGCDLGSDPCVLERVAVAHFEYVPRPLRIELQVAG